MLWQTEAPWESIYFVSVFEDMQIEAAGRGRSLTLPAHTAEYPEAERGKPWCSATFLLFPSVQSPIPWDCVAYTREGFSFLSQFSRESNLELCLLDGSQSSRVDNEDWSSQHCSLLMCNLTRLKTT